MYRETRAPAWCVGVDDRTTWVWFPDEMTRTAWGLVDVREPRERVAALARELGVPVNPDRAAMRRRAVVGYPAPSGVARIDIHEPSLLPDTTEADSLASFCLWLMAGAVPGASAEDGYSAARDRLVRAVEGAANGETSLDECHRRVSELAACDVDEPDSSGSEWRSAMRGIEGARTFLRIREAFPPAPTAGTPAVPEDEESAGPAFGR